MTNLYQEDVQVIMGSGVLKTTVEKTDGIILGESPFNVSASYSESKDIRTETTEQTFKSNCGVGYTQSAVMTLDVNLQIGFKVIRKEED